MSKIAFIGDRDSVLGLRALGVAAIPVSTPDEARARFGAAVTEGYAIIFVTEDVYEACADQIAGRRDQALPTVTALPAVRGSRGLAAKEIHRAVCAAVGADILAGGER
jgi:V/A-type H+-transporting ATPase subunit F